MKRLLAAVAGVVMATSMASPALASVTLVQQLSVMAEWTNADLTSFERWDDARQNKDDWADYGFDWTTDGCSAVPDSPFGFDFNIACQRHDFGYRNYKRVGMFGEDVRLGLDQAFYADMTRVCDNYGRAREALCSTIARLYYLGVREFGDGDILLPPDARAALQRSARNEA